MKMGKKLIRNIYNYSINRNKIFNSWICSQEDIFKKTKQKKNYRNDKNKQQNYFILKCKIWKKPHSKYLNNTMIGFKLY